MIRDNLAAINQKIHDICTKVGRNPEDIIVVAVSKYTTLERMAEAIDAGITHLGENRVAEGEEKFKTLNGKLDKVTKHLIGHLQTNKVKRAIENFDLIESVDSRKLLAEIQKQAQKKGKEVEVLIQVNIAGEDQKNGLDPDLVFDLLDQAQNLNHVRILGLMTMAPLTDNRDLIRRVFKQLKMLSDQIAAKYQSQQIIMKYLSMGMSQDYDIAIEEGANIVRIGRAIFNYE